MALDPNRFTRKTAEALGAAQAAARDSGHTEVSTEHVLRALVAAPEGIVPGVLERIGLAPASLLARIDEMLAQRPRVLLADEPAWAALLRECLAPMGEDGRLTFEANKCWESGRVTCGVQPSATSRSSASTMQERATVSSSSMPATTARSSLMPAPASLVNNACK